MKHYLTDEFIEGTCECTLEEQVDKKISLLYDMCILIKNRFNKDDREEAVRRLLFSYESETQIDNAVRDVIMRNYTLNDILKRKGYLQ